MQRDLLAAPSWTLQNPSNTPPRSGFLVSFRTHRVNDIQRPWIQHDSWLHTPLFLTVTLRSHSGHTPFTLLPSLTINHTETNLNFKPMLSHPISSHKEDLRSEFFAEELHRSSNSHKSSVPKGGRTWQTSTQSRMVPLWPTLTLCLLALLGTRWFLIICQVFASKTLQVEQHGFIGPTWVPISEAHRSKSHWHSGPPRAHESCGSDGWS
jgi:hypothetical protein